MNDDDDQYEKVIINHKKASSEYESEYDNDLIPASGNNEKVVVNTQPSSTELKSINEPNNAQKSEEHIYMNVASFGDVNLRSSDELSSKEIEVRESTGFDIAHLSHYENGLQLNLSQNEIKQEQQVEQKETVEFDAKFDTELVELNNQIKKLLTPNETEAKAEKKVDVEAKKDNRRVTIAYAPKETKINEEHEFEKPQVAIVARSKSNFMPKSASNDEIAESQSKVTQIRASFRLKPTEPTENVDSNAKRKSSISFDELKRRKSDNENNENKERKETTNTVIENEPKKQPQVYPKYRQSFSTGGSNDKLIQTKLESNLKNSNHRSFSKSLQDNSKLTKIEFKQNALTNQTNFELSESEETSVKSKIKLMESIVNSSKQAGTNERSCSSSSSSSSSSRSPPMSPKNTSKQTVIELVPAKTNSFKQPPIVAARTPQTAPKPKPVPPSLNLNLNKANLGTSLQPTFTTIVANESAQTNPTITSSSESVNNLNMNENSIYSDNSSNSCDLNESTKTSVKPLCNLKEKRRTVKELMSKFEPK